MSHSLFRATIFVLALSLTSQIANAQLPQPRERLGIRIGHVETTGDFFAAFSGGTDITLYFHLNIYKVLYLDVRIGSTSFGDMTDGPRKDELETIGVFDPTMQHRFLSAGPLLSLRTSDRVTVYAAAGIGIYSVTMSFGTITIPFDTSQQNAGANVSVGGLYRITDNWNVELHGAIQKLWTDATPDDLFYAFVGGESPLYYEVAVGVVMNLN